MTSEDFFIDGKTRNMFVLVRDDDPSSYFYFPAEFTLPKIVKWNDIEPARLLRRTIAEREYEIALTRVHYWCLVLWVNPKKHRTVNAEKPVIAFKLNFHTPYLFKDNYTIDRVDVEGGKALGWDENFILGIAMKHFRPGVRWSSTNPIAYPGIAKEIKPTVVADGQKFDNVTIGNNSAVLIVVGDPAEVNVVSLALKGSNAHVPIDSLRRFLSPYYGRSTAN